MSAAYQRRQHSKMTALWASAPILLICLSLLALTVADLDAATFTKQPYLIYEGDSTTMSVLWQADADAGTSTIEWGIDTGYGNGPVTVPPTGSDYQYVFTITGLDPGTQYFYRVEVDGTFLSGSFRTAPSGGTTATIWAYGDTRTDPAAQDQILAALLTMVQADPSRRQSLLLHSGDLVSNGERESAWSTEFFPADRANILEVHRTIPLMACRGNHEGDGVLFRKYFPYPDVDAVSFNYSFDYGPIHFTVLDDQSDLSVGSTQYNWIAGDLAASDACWKIVLFHEPAWGAGGHSNSTTNQTVVSNLLEPAGVDLVINGHNHYYSRTSKDGIQHITSGGGGAPLYDPDPSYPYVVTTARSYNFCRIDIDGDDLVFSAFDQNGVQLDSFSVRKGCPPFFADGFESGNLSAWSASVRAAASGKRSAD